MTTPNDTDAPDGQPAQPIDPAPAAEPTQQPDEQSVEQQWPTAPTSPFATPSGAPAQQPFGQQADYGQRAGYAAQPVYEQPAAYGQQTAGGYPASAFGQQPTPAFSEHGYGQPPAQGIGEPAQREYWQPPPVYGQQASAGYGPTAAFPQPGFADQQPAYGQVSVTAEQPAVGPARKSANSHTGALVGVILAVVVLAAAAIVLFWKPGVLNSTVFSQTAVQQGVTTILTNAPTDEPSGYGLSDVSDVVCPSGVKVKAGATFTCTLTQAGANKSVTITVVDDSGTYKVGTPR